MVAQNDAQKAGMYEPAGFFLLRTPALSANNFLRVLASGDDALSEDGSGELLKRSYAVLDELGHDAAVEQALIVASTDLHDGLERIQNGENKPSRLKRAYSGLFRYLVRMSTRPTPFGLFSGVAMGTLGAQTTLQLGQTAIASMRTRPDMAWLLALIQQIEEDKALLPLLRVVANKTSYIAGARAIIPHADVYGVDDNRSITLRATPVVRYVLEKAREPLPFAQLRDELCAVFPQAPVDKVDLLLQQLWGLHFLISDLRPPLTEAQPERYVLERLRTLPQLQEQAAELEEVIKQCRTIDKVGRGGAISLLSHLTELQEQMLPSYKGRLYQVDARLGLQQSQLNQEVGIAVADTIEALVALSSSSSAFSHLRDYHTAFVEKYGMGAEVPILDLLSPETGLDAPAGYTKPERTYQFPASSRHPSQEKDRLLCSLLTRALQEGMEEIELTDDLLEQLAPRASRPQNAAFPPALEMYLQLQAESREALDRGAWRGVIAPASLSYGGKTFCRFFDLLEEEQLERLRAYARQEEEFFPDAILAELSYLPSFGRGANVAVRPTLYPYEIVVNTTPSVPPERVIPLHDLVVGTTGEHFYIRSLQLQKEVIVMQSHMLNPMLAPNVCRFLLEASHDQQSLVSLFDWGIVSSAPYLPRVVRKKIVVSPAQWHLRKDTIQPGASGDEEARFLEGLRQWRTKWRVPRYVYLTEFDNRLLLDLEHPLSLAELRDELRKAKNKPVVLQEMLPGFEQLWLRDAQGEGYFAELVVPVMAKQQTPAVQQSLHNVSWQQQPVPDKERRFLPGSEWTFLKLYATFKQHDEIITHALREIANRLTAEGLIDRWFFIRYVDPEPHLRIRFHAANGQSKSTVMQAALAWGAQVVEYGLANNVVMDSYTREVERYGGPHTIDALERVFTVNSTALSEVVAALYTGEITLDPLVAAVVTLDHFFSLWGLDLPARLKYIQSFTDKQGFIESFRAQRRLLCELVQPWDPLYDPKLRAQGQQLLQLSARQQQVVGQVAREVRALAEKGQVWVSEEQLLGSLAHMHVNRLLGLKREQEQKIYAFWRHTLESIQRRPARKGEKVYVAKSA